MAVVFSKLQVAVSASTVAAIALYLKHTRMVGRKSADVILFDYHPIGMLVAFLALSTSGLLAEKLGIPNKHTIHKNFQIGALAVAWAALAAVWVNKDRANKAREKPNDRVHVMSYHSYVGVAAMAAYTGQALFGYFKVNPMRDLDSYMTNRALHKTFGQRAHLLALTATFVGWYKMAARHDSFAPKDVGVLGGIVALMYALGTEAGHDLVLSIA